MHLKIKLKKIKKVDNYKKLLIIWNLDKFLESGLFLTRENGGGGTLFLTRWNLNCIVII